MIGTILSLIALAAAWLIARRRRGHTPIIRVFASSTLYALSRLEDAPLTSLIILAAISASTIQAYAATWVAEPRAFFRLMAASALALLAYIFAVIAGVDAWAPLTWGPILASVLAGSFLLWRTKARADITTVTLAGILLGDALGLLTLLWSERPPWAAPLLAWQGRAQLIAVIGLQVGWLLWPRAKPDGRPPSPLA